MGNLTAQEQAQKLYEEFVTIYHPLFYDPAIQKYDKKLTIKCVQAKECTLKAVELLKVNSTDSAYWAAVIVEINKIN